MATKRKLPTVSTNALVIPKKTESKNRFSGRDALGAYISSPEKYDSTQVIFYDEGFVAVHDMFPKSSVHKLLIPRHEKFSRLHPFEAFNDHKFLENVRQQTAKLKEMVIDEIRRKYSSFPQNDARCEGILEDDNSFTAGKETPIKRNWANEVISGIHSRPSMNHLHVHVLSVDRFSECLKHRKHYNSFATNFFIPLEDFPLAQDDIRRQPEREGYLRSDLVCWRCGKNFGNRFTSLKKHLAKEFEEWKKD